MRFLATQAEDVQTMLAAIGVRSVDALFEDIPEELRLKAPLDLPDPCSELELEQELSAITRTNRALGSGRPSFLGAGIYNHFIPAFVGTLAGRGEFLTAYTPYQAEASQGTLQAMFEYQTMISEISGLPIANASLYDGPTSVMEGCVLAHNVGRRMRFLVSEGLHPETLEVLETLFRFTRLELERMPLGPDGRTVLPAEVGADIAAVVVQSPNFFGCLEDVEAAGAAAHSAGAHLVVSADPLTLSLIEAPGKQGADIVVGEAQVFGNGLSFGGPHLGYMACGPKFLRRLPGRLVGQTTDKDGKRAFTLTLQTREQHIRREKATSNICTNQGLIALRAAIYLAGLGKQNFQKLGRLCLKSAHYLARELEQHTLLRRRYAETPFFREVCFDSPVPVAQLNRALDAAGLEGGLALSRFWPDDSGGWLLATTDRIRRQDIDLLVQTVKEVEGCCR